MSARAHLVAVALAGALASLVGCADKPAPTAPAVRLGPAVEAVFPAARAVHVPVDTPIWVRFRAALDPASVGPTTVFLKLDTARLRCSIAYDAAERTVRIVPLETLRLRRTYTVELSPRLATAAGTTLDSTYFWQFTITTVRPLANPIPADGAMDQSPFAALGWDRTEPEAGSIRYEVWTAPDPAGAALHVGPPRVVTTPYLIAPVKRGFATTEWWTVRVTNLDTGEQATSPAWRFTTVAEGAAVDSLEVPALSYTSVPLSRPSSPTCNALTFNLGGGLYNTAIRWQVESAPRGLRLAGGTILLFPFSIAARTSGSVVYGVTGDFDGCSATFSGPPFRDAARGPLAVGLADAAQSYVRFRSDALSAHLQCAVRFGEPYGYAFLSDYVYLVYTPQAVGLHPILRLYYYRDPPGGAAAPADRAAQIARAPRRGRALHPTGSETLH